MEDQTPALPEPRNDARWRWATPGRALLGGGILAAVLSLAPLTAAGAATSHGTTLPGHPKGGARHMPSSGRLKPAAAGKIAALGGDVITIESQNASTQTVVYSSSTTFHDMSGTTSASALKVGEFISADGTKATDGTATATSIMVGGTPLSRGGVPNGSGARPPGGRGSPPGASA